MLDDWSFNDESKVELTHLSGQELEDSSFLAPTQDLGQAQDEARDQDVDHSHVMRGSQSSEHRAAAVSHNSSTAHLFVHNNDSLAWDHDFDDANHTFSPGHGGHARAHSQRMSVSSEPGSLADTLQRQAGRITKTQEQVVHSTRSQSELLIECMREFVKSQHMARPRLPEVSAIVQRTCGVLCPGLVRAQLGDTILQLAEAAGLHVLVVKDAVFSRKVRFCLGPPSD